MDNNYSLPFNGSPDEPEKKATVDSNNIIGCWWYDRRRDMLLKIEEHEDGKPGVSWLGGGQLVDRESAIRFGNRILCTHDDWLTLDCDGTTWEAWEDEHGDVILSIKISDPDKIFICREQTLTSYSDAFNNAYRKICRAMGIPIQPWEVKKEW